MRIIPNGVRIISNANSEIIISNGVRIIPNGERIIRYLMVRELHLMVRE